MTKELNVKKQELSLAQKQLEAETLGRVEAENRYKTMKEDLSHMKTIHEEELVQAKSARTYEMDEQMASLQAEYQARLTVELQELRVEHEERLAQSHAELESKYQKMMEQLETNIARKTEAESKLRADIQRLSSERDSISSKVLTLENANKSLEQRVKDLESLLAQERTSHEATLLDKDRQISDLKAQVQNQMADFKEKFDVKVQLGMEIDAYRKLLEGEEHRLSMSPGSSVGSASFVSGRSSSPSRRNVKRRRIFLEENYETDSKHNSRSNSDIEIIDHDVEGNYVQLRNKNEKNEVSIGNWQLIRKAGPQTTVYKFHRTVVLKPGAQVTIWSSGLNKTHNPPLDLVMKAQKWHKADEMTTTLLDPNNAVSTLL